MYQIVKICSYVEPIELKLVTTRELVFEVESLKEAMNFFYDMIDDRTVYHNMGYTTVDLYVGIGCRQLTFRNDNGKTIYEIIYRREEK